MPNPTRSADHPITSGAEDLLGRSELAALLADEVMSLDASHGAVVGVLWEWGSGKTSLINMMVERLNASSVPVVEFNPWLFSGTEQLVTAFFEELAAQLRPKSDRLGSIAGKLENYGESLSPLRFAPFFGPWLDKAGSTGAALGRFLRRRGKERDSVSALRQSLAEELAQLDGPMVVVVDDLDRLRSEGIREIFKPNPRTSGRGMSTVDRAIQSLESSQESVLCSQATPRSWRSCVTEGSCVPATLPQVTTPNGCAHAPSAPRWSTTSR